jgi:hypothetical protein
MMRRVEEILGEIGSKGREIVERELGSALKDSQLEWRDFYVLKEHEDSVKKLLNKAETWYFVCLVDEIEGFIEENGIRSPKVKVSVSKLNDWEDGDEYVEVLKPIKRRRSNWISAMIHVKK